MRFQKIGAEINGYSLKEVCTQCGHYPLEEAKADDVPLKYFSPTYYFYSYYLKCPKCLIYYLTTKEEDDGNNKQVR